jgi:hypothetical protein
MYELLVDWLLEDVLSVDQLSVDQLSVDQLSVDQLSVDQLSVDQWSVDQWSVDQWSVDQWSVDQWSVVKWSVDQLLVDKLSVDELSSSQSIRQFWIFNCSGCGADNSLLADATRKTEQLSEMYFKKNNYPECISKWLIFDVCRHPSVSVINWTISYSWLHWKYCEKCFRWKSFCKNNNQGNKIFSHFISTTCFSPELGPFPSAHYNWTFLVLIIHSWSEGINSYRTNVCT